MSLSFYPEPMPGEAPFARRRFGKYFQVGIWPYYPDIPLFQILKTTAVLDPKKPTILHPKRMTISEIDVLSDKLATALAALGARKGKTVALYMWNSPEFVIAFFGILKTGASVTALNPSFKEKDAEYQLSDSESTIAIIDDEQYPVIEIVREELPTLKNVIVLGEKTRPDTHLFKSIIEKHSSNTPKVRINPKKDLAVLQYTAGTTGPPMGCMLTHYNIVCNMFQLALTHGLEGTREDIVLAHLPFYHIYGMTTLICASVCFGLSLVIQRRFDMAEFLELIQRFKVTVAGTVMPVLTLFTQFPEFLKQYDLSSLRYISSGATPMVPETARRFEDLTGVTVTQGYGLSETSPVTHTNPLCQIKIESVGPPVPDTLQKIVDLETGNKELLLGEIGEVIIRGPQVMIGYWKRPKETAESLRKGWFYTGDLGRIDEDGYLYIVDRKKETIKYLGFTIGPAELEAVLLEHSAVGDCAVVGKPDPMAGEIPKAYVSLRGGAEVTEEELIQFVKERVAGYKRIREVEFVDVIPRSLAGKVLRREFIERERKLSQSLDPNH